ncbi:facilitated trehalose transporter Tret1 [Manduca sexta]|uniref:facilitated trehalose transporter Tret1 n=1 Tax=Manduca sexta TaxID=7130 RepID=UPI00188E2275|nr:facilitated trehalose transporter Tret1 [Manduca sexta]
MEIYLKRQLPIAACLYLGQMMVGYSMGWTAPVIPKLQDPELTPLPDVITDGEGSWIGSVLYIGTIIGPYVAGYFSNTIGRKPCLYMGGGVTLASFLFLALANRFYLIIIGRILVGLGSGTIAIVNLVYIGEIASTNIRGILLTASGIFGTFGTLVVYSVGPYIPYSATGYLGVALSFIYIAGVYFIPETPVFHILKGNETEARETLLSIGREEDIDKMISAKEDIPTPNKIQDWVEMFTIKSNRKAIFITLTLGILLQMSGVVAVIFFATTIFELAGSSIEPNIATIIIGVTQIVSSSIAPFFVERTGRKSLLLWSTGACCLSLAVLGIFFYLDHINHSSVPNIKWLPLASLILFFLSYDMGFGIIPGTFIGEMFRANVRSTGSTFSSTASWLVGFGVSTAFGYMLPALGGHVTFWIYSGSCALAFLFTVIFVPETKGKSLLEIEEMLSKIFASSFPNMFANVEPYVSRQILITACLNIGQMLIGYEIYWTGPVIPKLQNIEETPLTRVISATEASLVASLIGIGAVGAFAAGYAVNLIGRRACLTLAGIFMTISHLIVNFPASIGMIYAGRICIGASITLLSLTAFIYLGEIASPNIRGTLMSSASVFHSLGGFLVYCVGPYVSYAEIGYVLIGICVIYTATSFFIPESPLYYVIKGNEEAAKESLRTLGRNDDINTELKTMMEQVLGTKSNSYLWRELFTDKSNRRALCVTIPLYIFQQFSGIVAVIFFATTIFNSAGSSIQPHIATMIVGATSLFSSIFSPMFIDKLGRKILLIISTAGCCVSMTVVGMYFYLDYIGNSSVLSLRWLPLVCLVTSLFFYGIGLTIIPNTLTGEMFSPSVRGIGSSITMCVGLISGVISNTMFGFIVDAIGIYASFWIYAVVNATALVFVIVVVPETKGKTLTEIGNMMGETY